MYLIVFVFALYEHKNENDMRGCMYFFRLGTTECLIILVLLIIVAGLSFRQGYFRGRRRK